MSLVLNARLSLFMVSVWRDAAPFHKYSKYHEIWYLWKIHFVSQSLFGSNHFLSIASLQKIAFNVDLATFHVIINTISTLIIIDWVSLALIGKVESRKNRLERCTSGAKSFLLYIVVPEGNNLMYLSVGPIVESKIRDFVIFLRSEKV